MTAGFDVLVQLVMAAISTAPSRISSILTVDLRCGLAVVVAALDGFCEMLLIGAVGTYG